MTGKFKPESTLNHHLTDEEILCFVEQQVPLSDAERMGDHAEACEECQVRIKEFWQDLAWFAELHKSSNLPPSLVENPPIVSFERRLQEHACKERSEGKGSTARVERWHALMYFFWQHKAAAVVVMTAIALVVITTVTFLDPRASAETVLLRAENYESRLRPKSGAVSRAIVRVEVSMAGGKDAKKAGRVTLVRDSATTAVYATAELPDRPKKDVTILSQAEIGTLGEQTFGNTNMIEKPILEYFKRQNCFPDVSITEFRKLVAGRGMDTTRVSARWGILELHFPFLRGHVSGIQEAVLRVEANTYAPLELILFTWPAARGQEYHFVRSSISLLSRTDDWSRVLPAPGPQSTNSLKGAFKEPARLLSYANSKATAEEVSVAQALHKAESCLGEEIFVFPIDDGSILVQGLVDRTSRRDLIRQSLSPLKSEKLRIEIYVPDELGFGTQLYASPDGIREAVSSSPEDRGSRTQENGTPAEIATHDALYQAAIAAGKNEEEAEKQVSKVSHEITGLARTLLLHAWALKRLDEEFAPSRVAELEGVSMSRIEGMRKDHSRAIAELAAKLSHMLAAIENGALADADTESDGRNLLALAQDQDRLVRRLFTSSTQKVKSNSDLAPLGETLRRIQSIAR